MASTIYFSGSITGGRQDVAQYRRIVAQLEADGHRVLAGVVAAEEIGDHGESFDRNAIFERDLGWMREADILVAEVSVPSTGVGYEIAAARYHFHKPVICLYRPAWTKRCTAMIAGDGDIELIEYQDFGEMVEKLRSAIARIRE